jgi:hypothetical protein
MDDQGDGRVLPLLQHAAKRSGGASVDCFINLNSVERPQ